VIYSSIIMTIITIEKSSLKAQKFPTDEALIKALIATRFENHLDTRYKRAKVAAKKGELVNI